MAHASDHFMDFEDHVLQQRLVRLLQSRQRYQRDGAKNLARDIGCTERTAKNILGGHWPRAAHLRAIVATFGRDAWDALFGPDIDETSARLAREVRDLEQKLQEKRDALARAVPEAPQSVAGLREGRAGRDRHEDGAAALTAAARKRTKAAA